MLRLASIALFVSLSAELHAERPNVLLIITDDQGYGDLSSHGNTVLQTPAMDKLGAESIRFDRFFVSPLCAPTRASLLTGRYSLRTGTRGVSNGEETMRTEETTVAEILRDNGYATGIFGKWHQGDNAPDNPEAQGFQHVFGYNRGHWNNYFDTEIKRNGKPVVAPGFIVDATTTEALSFIDKATSEKMPFLAWVAYTTPHSPFQVPDKYFDTYKAKGLSDELACVYGMCANLDDNLARLLAHLDSHQLRDNTIVIFLTDNGPNTDRFNGDMKGRKGSPDEGGSRVPFFLRWPARFKEPRMVKQIAAHIDVLPTLVELLDLPKPKTLPWDGVSLVPLMEGKAGNWPDRTLFTQWTLQGKKGKVGAAVRTQNHRAVLQGATWSLYDMISDPGQAKDIADTAVDTLASLTSSYKEWRSSIQADIDKPRDLPQLGNDFENPLELTTPNSTFTPPLNFGGKAPNNAWLVDWSDPAASVSWKVNVVTAGTYDLKLQFLCPSVDAGSTIQLTNSTTPDKLTATVPGTEIVVIPSPDRAPRKSEVMEHKWSYLNLGKLQLPKGETTFTVTAPTIKGSQAMWLKALWLEKQ